MEYLSRARNLVLCDYHNTMLGTGDAQEDDPATAGKCEQCIVMHVMWQVISEMHRRC